MNLIDDPAEVIDCPPVECRRCGADLAGAPVSAQRRHQVTDIGPAPPPKTTEYRAQAKVCGCCGETTAGELRGISKLDALRGLFNGHAWLPPALEPA